MKLKLFIPDASNVTVLGESIIDVPASDVCSVSDVFVPYGCIVFVDVVPSILRLKLFAPDASNVAVLGASVKDVADVPVVWRVSVVFVPYGCIVFVAVVPSTLSWYADVPLSNVADVGSSVTDDVIVPFVVSSVRLVSPA